MSVMKVKNEQGEFEDVPALQGDVTEFLSLAYPVGAIYLSVNDINPGTLFGGTWERIEDTFLLACGSAYAIGSTGGEATHTLTVGEMPSHNHGISYQNVTVASGGTYTNELAGSENFNTNETGESQPHNNMPPYLAINVWKRIS